MTLAVYPRGVIPWTDRVDLSNIVYANDPNSLAAEVSAIETVLGTMPQVESSPPTGPAITYSTVGARIHDSLVGTQQPVVSLSNPLFQVGNAKHTNPDFVFYNVTYDPFGWYNGNDVTVKADGWYTVSAHHTIDWWSSGYIYAYLTVAGSPVCDHHWDWDFPGNQPGGFWGQRQKTMSLFWQGVIHSGSRVQVYIENSTAKTPLNISAATLRVKFDRQVSHTQQG